MTVARIFKSGGSQAVRLPKQFRFDGKEVEIFRRGDEVVLRQKPRGMAQAFELIANLPAEIDEITDSPPQKRKGL